MAPGGPPPPGPSAPSGRIKETLGLTDSVRDKDVWQYFLRISKKFHESLDIQDVYWGALTVQQKETTRRQLKQLCHDKGLFIGRDIDPALQWRLYQLQKNCAPRPKQPSGQMSASMDAGPSSMPMSNAYTPSPVSRTYSYSPGDPSSSSVASSSRDQRRPDRKYDPVRDLKT